MCNTKYILLMFCIISQIYMRLQLACFYYTEILTFFKATGISQVDVCNHGNVAANERTENMNVNNAGF